MERIWERTDAPATEEQKKFGRVFQEYIFDLVGIYASQFAPERNKNLAIFLREFGTGEGREHARTAASANFTIELTAEDADTAGIDRAVRINWRTEFLNEEEAIVEIDDSLSVSIDHLPRGWYYDPDAQVVWSSQHTFIDSTRSEKYDTERNVSLPPVSFAGSVAVKDASLARIPIATTQHFADLDLSPEGLRRMLQVRQPGPDEEDRSRAYEFVLEILKAMAHTTGTEALLNERYKAEYGMDLFPQFRDNPEQVSPDQ